MRSELAKNATLINAENNVIYTITDVIGRGASCIVYKAEAQDRTQHILKEYNPKYLEIPRNEVGTLCPGEAEKKYNAGLNHFRAGYERQLHIRNINELTNVTSNIQTIFRANGTEYIDMTCFNGVTFEQVECSSLFDLLCYIKSVAKVVAEYHRNGFLHLDIKPENIFTIPETPNFVMLFDFDSIVEKDALFTSPVLSYTKSWAAPEQILPNRKNRICEATDIFAIGEILFYKIFDRHSTLEERRASAEYSFDREQDLLSGLDDYCFELLSEMLKNTICTTAGKRYQTVDELLLKLETLIPLTNTAALRAYGRIHGFKPADEKEIISFDEKLIHSAVRYFSDSSVVWTKLSGSPPPEALFAALADYASELSEEEVLVFVSYTRKGKDYSIITRDGFYSNYRGGFKPIQFKWNSVECFLRANGVSHYQTKDKVEHYIYAEEKELLGLQGILREYKSAFSKTESFSFEEKMIRLVCECEPSYRVLWTKLSAAPPPDTLYRAIAEYAPDITVDDVLVFINDSFTNKGRKNTIITREGLYSNARGISSQPIHFRWEDIDCFFADKHGSCYYKTKAEEEYYFRISANKKALFGFQEILKAYKMQKNY